MVVIFEIASAVRSVEPHRSRHRPPSLARQLPAPAADRLDDLANCVDHELGLLLVDLVATVRVGNVFRLGTSLASFACASFCAASVT